MLKITAVNLSGRVKLLLMAFAREKINACKPFVLRSKRHKNMDNKVTSIKKEGHLLIADGQM